MYTLERGGEVLGTLTVTAAEFLGVHGTFEATPAFAPYRPLFDAEAALSARVAKDPDPALLAQAEAALERILALGLVLRRSGDLGHRDVLLGIEGDQAAFRPLTPEEQVL